MITWAVFGWGMLTCLSGRLYWGVFWGTKARADLGTCRWTQER